jgi:hypothetical protein
MDDLLPCPLCQGTVDHWSDHFYCDTCKCDFVFYDRDGNPTAPLERFNRRTPPPATAKVLKMTRRIKEGAADYFTRETMFAMLAEWPNEKAPE